MDTVNLERYQMSSPHDARKGRFTWQFPNGIAACVNPDVDAVLRWCLWRTGTSPIEYGLTSEQVEARLAEIAALPAKEAS